MQKSKNTLTIIGIIAAILLAMILFVIFSRIPKNPAGTLGNTAGNILNKGLFCEADGKVYFSRGNDSGALYVMNPDETSVKKLLDHDVCYINAAGKYIYYYELSDNNSDAFSFLGKNMGIYRCDLKGNGSYCLQKAPVNYVLLADNTVYYEYFATVANGDPSDSGIGLYSVEIQQRGRTLLSEDPVVPANIYNGVIYYAGQSSDHNLHAFSISSKQDVSVQEGSFWNPIIYGSYVYYMNPSLDYKLCRRAFPNGNEEVLTDDRVDCFNVASDDKIYYQKNSTEISELAFKRMNLDGSSPELIMSGNFTNINVTSRYVYFSDFSNRANTYHQSLGGAVAPSLFNP